MIKDATRTTLITRRSQCQDNVACLRNDVNGVFSSLSLSASLDAAHEEDLYIHTNNATAIAYRLIKNM